MSGYEHIEEWIDPARMNRIRPKLIERIGFGNNLFMCEKDEVWESHVWEGKLKWFFYCYAVGEPIEGLAEFKLERL